MKTNNMNIEIAEHKISKTPSDYEASIDDEDSRHHNYNYNKTEQRLTPYIVVACLMAGSGGLMYGYDLVVAGGVLVMEDFLMKFYPNVYLAKQSAKQDNYCKYNNQVLQLYTSCLYLAALFATFMAGSITRRHGHRRTMLYAGLLFMGGTALGAGAQNLEMLILGRVLLGCGLGFANQAIPLYVAEIAPWRLRGMLGIMFGINIGLGIFLGNLVNYGAAFIHPWGWRVSLGVTGIPAITITLAGLTLVDTPTFLIRQKKHDEAKHVLSRIRGPGDHRLEFNILLNAINAQNIESNELMESFRNLFQHKNTPQLVMAIALPFFQQFSGNDAILFYGPFLLKVGGLGTHGSLYSTLIVGAIGVFGILVSMFIVDRVGRRIILLIASIVMFLSMVAIGTIFALQITPQNAGLTATGIKLVLLALCCFNVAFNGSLGPFAWLIPSEIFPQDIRSAAQSITVFTNMLFKFIIAQTLLSMLCAFKYGIFLFFAGWVFITGCFTMFLLPETKGVPLDKMVDVWKAHWFWGLFTNEENIK